MFDLAALEMMRSAEIEAIIPYFRPGVRILEIGAGTGQQALALSRSGFAVEAIEIKASPYGGERVYPITEYDGLHIPFLNASFDVVFSSNVFEHVPYLSQLNDEIRRVLKLGGYAVHVMPTPSWRLWTSVSSVPAAMEYALRARAARSPSRAGTTSGPPSGRLQKLRRHFGRHGEHGNVVFGGVALSSDSSA